MENQNALVLQEEYGHGMMETSVTSSYCSFEPITKEEKMVLFNAQQNPDERLASKINEVINVKHIVAEMVQLRNEQTGEVNDAPRIILIDDKNKTYVACSLGVFSAVKRILNIFGEPSTWENPLPLKVKQIEKQNKRLLTLEVVAK